MGNGSRVRARLRWAILGVLLAVLVVVALQTPAKASGTSCWDQYEAEVYKAFMKERACEVNVYETTSWWNYPLQQNLLTYCRITWYSDALEAGAHYMTCMSLDKIIR